MDDQNIPSHLQYVVKSLTSLSNSHITIPRLLKSEKEAEYVADLMREKRHISTFSMSHATFPERITKPILSALAECKSLRSLEFTDTWLTDKNAPAVAQALENMPYIQHVRIINSGLTEEGFGLIADALKNKTELESVDFSDQKQEVKCGQHLAALMESCPNLHSITARRMNIGDEGFEAIAAAYPKNDSISFLSFSNCSPSPEAAANLSQTMLNTPSHNLVHVDMEGAAPELKQLTHDNKTAMQKAADLLESAFNYKEIREDEVELVDDLHELTAGEIAKIRHHLPGIKAVAGLDEATEAFCDMLDMLPELEQGQPATLENLTHKRFKSSPCALDNPLTWEKMPEIAEQLQTQGTPLTREFLAQKSKTGEDYLTAGLLYAPKQAMRALNASGLQIGYEDLIDTETRTPTQLCKTLAKYDSLNDTFSPKNWTGKPVQELRATYNALPEAMQSQVQGYHSLTARLSQAAQPKGMGRA